jgi:hypothetical protein
MSISVSEHTQQEYDDIEVKLEKVGIGYSREMANKFGSTLAENIKGIDVNQPGLEESKFGRKLYSTVKTMMKFGGEIFKIVIEADYPLELFIQKKAERIAELQKLAEESEDKIDFDLREPVPETFSYSADIEIEEEMLILEEAHDKKKFPLKKIKRKEIQMTQNHHCSRSTKENRKNENFHPK